MKENQFFIFHHMRNCKYMQVNTSAIKFILNEQQLRQNTCVLLITLIFLWKFSLCIRNLYHKSSVILNSLLKTNNEYMKQRNDHLCPQRFSASVRSPRSSLAPDCVWSWPSWSPPESCPDSSPESQTEHQHLFLTINHHFTHRENSDFTAS